MNNQALLQSEMQNAAGLRFDLFDFFNGDVAASGLVTDRFNIVRSHFKAHFKGVLSPSGLIVDERVVFDTGNQSKRQWHMSVVSEGEWSATAEGIIGHARIIRDDKNPCRSRWHYGMMMPVGRRTLNLSCQDIMAMTNADHIIALTPLRKWGILVGHITSAYWRV